MLVTFIIVSLLAMAYLKFAPRPQPKAMSLKGLPAGFNATHRHDCIAVDSVSKKLWVKDKSGRERVFDPVEIISWEHKSVEVRRNFSVWHEKNEIQINVTDLDRPIWRAPFNSLTYARSYKDAQEWFIRLDAIYNHHI